jgi:diketogulonate reductase-like aldo/keto reductase
MNSLRAYKQKGDFKSLGVAEKLKTILKSADNVTNINQLELFPFLRKHKELLCFISLKR